MEAATRERIGIVAPEAPGPIGGMQRYAWHITKGLLDRGYRVMLFVRRGNGHSLDLPGAEIQAVLEGCVGEDEKLLRAWDHRIDLWHAMNAGYAWLSRHPVPCVVSVYGNDFLRPWIPITRRTLPLVGSRINHWLKVQASRRLLRVSCGKAARILAISEYSKAVLLEKYPTCFGKVEVVYGGVDSAWLRSEPRRKDERHTVRLLTVCRLEDRRKNVDLVLEALGRLSPRYDFEYSVVGDGPLKAELEARARQLEIEEKVHFLGNVSDGELLERFAEADLFVLVSSRNAASFEGFGLVYIEANAAGTPVLAAKAGGAPEAVRDGVNGFLAEDVSVQGIQDALSRFLSRATRFNADDCRAHAARFTWEVAVENVERIYRQVLND